MSVFEDKGHAERTAKKIAIQTRAAAKKRKTILDEKWLKVSGSAFSFLEPETSLAIWINYQRRQISSQPEEIASTIFEAKLGIEQFSKFLSEIEIVHGFCFAYNWETTGAFIVNVKRIGDHLSDLMFMFEDELKFYSQDFTKSFELLGDRTGTGEDLNTLSVGVKGQDWAKKWEIRSLTR